MLCEYCSHLFMLSNIQQFVFLVMYLIQETGNVTKLYISWRCKMHARYSGNLPGSGLYVDLWPGWSTTAEHKRRSIAGSAASTKRPDSPRRCGATSCRRVHSQSRGGSALKSASTCRERARMRRDGSWRWHNLKEKNEQGSLEKHHIKNDGYVLRD